VLQSRDPVRTHQWRFNLEYLHYAVSLFGGQ
jgi:hypothetical protein